MNILNTISSRLNRYSLIGSFLYGLLCAFSATPEIFRVIGYVAYFLSAALFYFTMYVLYTIYKEPILNLRHNFLKKSLPFLLKFSFFITAINIIYMVIYRVSFSEAVDQIANYIGTFFYYIPFLP